MPMQWRGRYHALIARSVTTSRSEGSPKLTVMERRTRREHFSSAALSRPDGLLHCNILLLCATSRLMATRRASLAICLGPFEPLYDGATHHPILVILGQEIERLGKLGDTLAPGRSGKNHW
jgi:hypothetical protein